MNESTIQTPPNLPIIPRKKARRSDALTIFLLIIFLIMLIIGSDLATAAASRNRTHNPLLNKPAQSTTLEISPGYLINPDR